MTTFVYVMKCGAFAKVGHAVDPQKRRSTLQMGNPMRVDIAFSMEASAPMALEIERLAHASLEKHAARGEWFKIGVGRAVRAVIEARRKLEPDWKDAVTSEKRAAWEETYERMVARGGRRRSTYREPSDDPTLVKERRARLR